jgi:hypothetical protein
MVLEGVRVDPRVARNDQMALSIRQTDVLALADHPIARLLEGADDPLRGEVDEKHVRRG